MSKERFAERKAELRNALVRLREAAAHPESDLVRDAVIQRSEFTFELVWKSLKLYLERQGLECGGPRSTLKNAFAEGLIHSRDEADAWLRALEEAPLIYKLDLVRPDQTTSERLKEKIEREGIAIYPEESEHLSRR